MTTATESPASYKILSEPSCVIKVHNTTVTLEDIPITMTLVTMKRSFLLALDNRSDSFTFNTSSSPEALIEGFMGTNSSLKGLSMAIGDCSSCLIPSNSDLSSSTLALRLSKKFNSGGPVYVANNFEFGRDTIDTSEFLSRLYMKVFQFVGNNYRLQACDTAQQ